MANLAVVTHLAFRARGTLNHRCAQDAIGALEYLASLLRKPLRHGPEDTDDVSDDRWRPGICAGNRREKTRARGKPERNQEQLHRASRCGSKCRCLAVRKRLGIVSSVVNTHRYRRTTRADPTGDDLGIESGAPGKALATATTSIRNELAR